MPVAGRYGCSPSCTLRRLVIRRFVAVRLDTAARAVPLPGSCHGVTSRPHDEWLSLASPSPAACLPACLPSSSSRSAHVTFSRCCVLPAGHPSQAKVGSAKLTQSEARPARGALHGCAARSCTQPSMRRMRRMREQQLLSLPPPLRPAPLLL